MNVINRKTLREYYKKYPDAIHALETWYQVCRKNTWKNFNEVRKAYPSSDPVGDDRVVFNIKGGRYRLVVRFSFTYKAIQLKWFGTHAEYNKVNVLNV